MARSPAGGPPWTPSFLAFILPLSPEKVLRVEGLYNSATPESREEWVWIQTAQRLTWLYGAAGALNRLNGYGA
jgi:hypothetical protein